MALLLLVPIYAIAIGVAVWLGRFLVQPNP